MNYDSSAARKFVGRDVNIYTSYLEKEKWNFAKEIACHEVGYVRSAVHLKRWRETRKKFTF